MSTTTDFDRVNEYMMLRQLEGKVSDEVFNSWKALAKEIKKKFEIKNPTCEECGKKPATHYYCTECHNEIMNSIPF